jgi:signal transduction histidine kinase
MKIVPKLTAALVAGMCIVLGINGYIRVTRETKALEDERLRRHAVIARAVRTAVRATWKVDGEEAALATLDATVARHGPIDASWIPVGAALEHLDGTARARSPADPVTTIDRHVDPPIWYTYVPVDIGGKRRGEIELAEAAITDRENARSIFNETLKTAAGLAALSAIIAFVLGHWIVGRPVRVLAQKAQRIGRGEFDGPLELRSADELAELAREMNAMCERLATTIDQLRHADRLATVGKLASGVAHELGTPLNVVSARAEMILAGRTSMDENREYARVIATAAERMTATISQLLQFARRKNVQRDSRDVAALVRETADLLRPLAKRRSVEIDIDIDSAGEASVDGGQLQQVVTNLVMNAIQASKEGGHVMVSVRETTESPPADIGGPRRDGVSIRVEDEGAGIRPEDLPHIFEPFFTTKEVGEGTGLGLAVSYGIVRDHGGWISVQSEVGVGTTFSAFLPHGVVT